jgi:acetolactate synthase-1/2/3 large subunit
VQNADLVLSLGSRLSVCSTGHEYGKFAREARTIVVDIDPEEHRKDRSVHQCRRRQIPAAISAN